MKAVRVWMSRVALRGLAAACLVLLACGASHAQGGSRFYVLASGERGKTYHDQYAPNLIKLLKAFHVRNQLTKGSVQNLEMLASRDADIAFAQADVYAAELRANKARYKGITVIGELADECVYVARRVPGPVESIESLGAPIEGRSPKIAVGSSGGGMSSTWRFLRELDPALKGAQVVDTGGALALNHLSLGIVDAVGWVTDPMNMDHVMLRAVMANPEIALLPLDSPTLEHALDDGTRIYYVGEVVLGDGKKPETLQTLCTSSMLFARPEANPRLVEAVSQVLSLQRHNVLRKR